MEMFAGAAGIELFHIPYQGGGPAVTALLGGQVQALASGPAAAVGQIKGGKMRALAGWGAKRLELMPDLPTFKELGYKDVEFYIWSGVVAPAAIPANVQHKLRAAVRAAVADPQFIAAMAKVSTPISYLDAPEFKDFWVADAARLRVAVEKIGMAAAKKK
jgi:tripartite-type tricarboxylate transporter receptor subunit TctC